jgi:type II secretory pathway component PulJ
MSACDPPITQELEEIRAAVVALRADLRQATFRIEEQAKQLSTLNQVRGAFETSTICDRTTHITTLFSANRVC